MSNWTPSHATKVQPAIAELFRSCRYPPSLLLRLERILRDENLSVDGDQDYADKLAQRQRGINNPRLYLGDGKFMVQALLFGPAYDLVGDRLFVEGALLKLIKFTIEYADRLNGNGQVIYLAIEKLHVVGITGTLSLDADMGALEKSELQRESGGLREVSGIQDWEVEKAARETCDRFTRASNRDMSSAASVPSSQESDGFETAEVDKISILQRRRLLKRKRVRFQDPSPSAAPEPHAARGSKHQTPSQQMQPQEAPEKMQGSITQRPQVQTQLPQSTQAPLHSLNFLINPPTPLPARNYVCSVFAVISWISPSVMHKAPFPPKRFIKVHDPSISYRRAGITIAVFVNARRFLPKVGTIALFRGVTMQRWEGEVILNAYAHLKDEAWFVDDPAELEELGCDRVVMEEWWKERTSKKTG